MTLVFTYGHDMTVRNQKGIDEQSGSKNTVSLKPSFHAKTDIVMKKLLTVVAIGFVLFSCSGKKKEVGFAKNSDLVTENLRGDVQTQEETTYTADSTGKTKAMDSCCVVTAYVNEKGYTDSTVS